MRVEFAAFKTRMEESPVLAGKVHPIVRKTKGTPVRDNYVVAKSAKPDRLGDDRLTAVQEFDSDRRFTFDVRVVTTSADGLDVLGEAVLRQLLGHRLVVEGRDMAIACGKFFDGVMEAEPKVRHVDQPQLNVALSVARKRPLAGAWAWNRKDESSDITPIVSATLALWGAQKDDVERPSRRRTSERMAVIL